ncbi:MAG: DAK2 domain-containing protein [Acidimicrobiales bacterium]|nr:DAK2 domain-containing protein [Acidimicrobiales bacterium]
MTMTALEQLTVNDLRAVMATYAAALRAHREAINRLNVYPVPDGDTGTNMALTLESVVAEVEAVGAELEPTCAAISHGSLMGARGNSGVILSQILRGFAEVIRVEPVIDARVLARALTRASEAAYGAVMKPVEGTILTVVRVAAEEAGRCASAGGSLVDVLSVARDAAGSALEETPELLPVLKEAGVVDAGGAGFVLLLDSILHVVDGRPLPEPDIAATPDGVAAMAEQRGRGHSEDEVSGLRYEVMFFLEAPDHTIPAFKDVWAGVGDSIVVVGGDGLWNCHIHTDDIGAAIEAALDCGRPRKIRVTDLLEQVEEERWVREAGMESDRPAHADEPVTTAVVAVATGAGVSRIFHSLGVQRIVPGGQTMNPSTAQLLEAVESAPADDVIILPNNKNIIPVAEQVQLQTTKKVYVVPTEGIAEGFASLLSYDPESPGSENAEAMRSAAEAVVAGEVTQAVRDSVCDLGPIAKGDWIGLSREGIVSVAGSVDEACVRLLDALIGDEHELVTIIEGEGASDATTRRVIVWLQEHRPGIEAEVHHGGQPLYPYLFGIE